MAKNITIAKLDMDTNGLIDSMQKTAKQIEDLRDKQEKLAQKGKEGTEQFQANEAALKLLTTAQRTQTAALSAQITEDGKLVSVKKAVKDAVNEVNNSENDYIANNQRLLALKKQLNSNDDDYEKRLAAVNGKLQENNNWLQENGSAHAKLITTMDDYKQQISDSFDSINIFNGGLSGFTSRAQEAGGTGPLLKTAFQGITGGINGITKAVMANPLGLLLAAGMALINMFKNFTPLVEKAEQVMAALDAVTQAITNAFIGLFTGSPGDFFKSITTGAVEAASAAMELKEAQQELAAQMEKQEILNDEAATSIKKYTDKMNDQTLSEEERTTALEEAWKLEKKNYDERMSIGDKTYANAVKQIAIGKNLTADELKNLDKKGFAYAQELAQKKSITNEELDTLKKAQLERNKLAKEETTLSENKIKNLEKIQQDAAAKREAEEQKRLQRELEREQKRAKYIQDAIERQKLELDIFILNQGIKGKAMLDELTLAQQIADKKRAIADAEFNASDRRINDKHRKEIEYSKISIDLAEVQKNIAIANAQKELENFIAANKSKLDNDLYLSDEMVATEKIRLKSIAAERKRANDTLSTDNAISKEEYNKQAAVIDAENTEQQNQLNDQRTNAKKAKDAIDLENKRAADTVNYDYDTVEQQKRLDAQMAIELENAKATGASEIDIKAKYSKMKNDMETAVMNNKLDLASSTFGNLAAIMGKESAAGKAMAVAQATIDTYKSAVSAYSAMAGIAFVGPALGAVAAGAAVAAGIANVKKITSTKPPKAEKGALFNIGGNRHSAGGTMFTGADGTQFEAEQGELIGVMNRNAARHFMAFNNAFPAGGASAPNYFAGGGIVSREIAQQTLNTDELAMKIAQANSMLPPPVVAVQDIITQGNDYVRVRDAANF